MTCSPYAAAFFGQTAAALPALADDLEIANQAVMIDWLPRDDDHRCNRIRAVLVGGEAWNQASYRITGEGDARTMAPRAWLNLAHRQDGEQP